MIRFFENDNPFDELVYHKVASSRLSQLVTHSRIFRLGIWCLWTVTYGQNSSKLNSRPVYCSWLYGTLPLEQKHIRQTFFLYRHYSLLSFGNPSFMLFLYFANLYLSHRLQSEIKPMIRRTTVLLNVGHLSQLCHKNKAIIRQTYGSKF